MRSRSRSATCRGLTILGERTYKFAKVATGDPHNARVQVRADAEGLYYLSVIAKMATQVQTEARAFSVPIVVGKVPCGCAEADPAEGCYRTANRVEPARRLRGELRCRRAFVLTVFT